MEINQYPIVNPHSVGTYAEVARVNERRRSQVPIAKQFNTKPDEYVLQGEVLRNRKDRLASEKPSPEYQAQARETKHSQTGQNHIPRAQAQTRHQQNAILAYLNHADAPELLLADPLHEVDVFV